MTAPIPFRPRPPTGGTAEFGCLLLAILTALATSLFVAIPLLDLALRYWGLR